MKQSHAITLSVCATILLSAPAFAHEHGGKDQIKGKIGKMFDRTDANQDEQLDLAEFLAHAEQRFKAMDLNADGYVTKEEGREAHKQMREKRRAQRKERREQRGSERATTE